MILTLSKEKLHIFGIEDNYTYIIFGEKVSGFICNQLNFKIENKETFCQELYDAINYFFNDEITQGSIQGSDIEFFLMIESNVILNISKGTAYNNWFMHKLRITQNIYR